jgi:Domain of unknown function (DUF5666)
MTSRRNLLAATLLCCLAGAAVGQTAAIAQTATPVRVRGTIDAVDAQTMRVTSRDGQHVTLAVAPDIVVTAILPASIADIKPGSYIGTAAMPQEDGSLLAFEIQLFPDSMRGIGEGHHPWDLQPQSTMTNGTVGDVVVTQGRTLTLRYKDGEKKVVVPEKAPIITYAPATAAMLTPGAHVIVTAIRQPDGSLVAQRVGVGKDGLVPPM